MKSGDAAQGLGSNECAEVYPIVGRVPPPGVPRTSREPEPPHRLRRLDRLWPDREGNISYLITLCVEGRSCVLNNDGILQRLVAFLIDSPSRYHWFGRRFVVMPDPIHLIAHQDHEAIRLSQWIKALKAVVGGLRCADTGRVPPPGVHHAAPHHKFTRAQRPWRWQEGFHDHKFRTPESEARKWEYVCLNPVRYKLVSRPEQWPYGGEIFYDQTGRPRFVSGTPPLLETGLLIEEDGRPKHIRGTPGEGTPPAT